MTYKLTVEQKPAYLHLVVTGQNNSENAAGYINQLFRECRARGCFRVLIEERLEGPRLGAMDVFDIVSNAIKEAKMLKAIAYVDLNAKGDLMHFAETLAVNRGVRMANCSTVAEAEQWLLQEIAAGSHR